jgi:TPR repeat protein
VIGAAAVLTARHVVAGALDNGRIMARVVRPGASTADWVPMAVLAEDAEWDVAVLCVSDQGADADDSWPRWLEPSSPSPVFVRLSATAEHGCEVVGFPQSEVQKTPDSSPVSTVRQSEQATGTLLPAGQAKTPVNPERPLPKLWIPFDVEGSTPGTQAGWGGMSGAGVILPDGRLVGLVAAAEAGHQQRRLYVVPFANALVQSGGIAKALATLVKDSVVTEVREAQLYREVLQAGCLGPDGFPSLVGEASYKAFGVKLAGVPGEPAFLDYVPREADQKLRDGMYAARAQRRMLLVVGGSASGKSRSAAEAVRLHLADHRLLCPRQTSLGRLHDLPVADLGPALIWLDDAERYEERAFRDTVEWLLRSGFLVVATIRRSELEAKMPRGDLRNPFGEALTDAQLMLQVAWPVIWKDQERQRVREHVKYPALLVWVATGKSPCAWVVAGPALQDKLRFARTDDERPARYALVRSVLDWYRTSIAQPIPLAVATTVVHNYLSVEPETADIDDALRWALESVTGASRLTSQSLLTKISGADALTVHDYIQDADAKVSARPVPDAVWMAAFKEAASDDARLAISLAAALQGNAAIAAKGWLPFANKGNSVAMYNLGVLLNDTDPAQAREWWQQAAEAGQARAMYNLGVLLNDTDPAQAREWWQQAAEAGHAGAMNNLGALLENRDPVQALQWYQQAAEIGDGSAMYHLGVLLNETDPAQAREWWQRAAEAGHAGAMNNLGVLLNDSDPAQAREWWQRAAETGHADAMNNLKDSKEVNRDG